MARRRPTDVRTATIASYGALICSLCLYVASLSPLASKTPDMQPRAIVSLPTRPPGTITASPAVKATASSAAVQEAFEFEGAPLWDAWWTAAARIELLRIANRTSHLQHPFRASGSRGVLVVSVANFEYRAVLLNWLHALARLRIQNYLLVSLDRDIGEFFQSLGVASVFDPWRDQRSSISSYGSQAVHPLSLRAVWKLRTEVLAALLHGGYSVVLSDTDAVWLRDPSPWLWHGVGDVVASRGSFPKDLYEAWGTTLCMGLAYFHAGIESKRLVRLALAAMSRGGVSDDQVAVNRALKVGAVRWRSGAEAGARLDYTNSTSTTIGYASVGQGQPPVRVALLPHHKFRRLCSDVATISSSNVVVLHCNTQKNGVAKEAALRKNGAWFLTEDWKLAVDERRRSAGPQRPTVDGWQHEGALSAWLLEIGATGEAQKQPAGGLYHTTRSPIAITTRSRPPSR